MSQPRGRILIIDDDSELLETLDLLISDSHDTVPVLDARNAIQMLLKGESFDVIMCDLTMPHMSGPEFYESLEKVAPHFCSRVLFLTGGSFTQKSTAFLNRPGIQYCEKPIQFEVLLERLQNIMQKFTLDKKAV